MAVECCFKMAATRDDGPHRPFLGETGELVSARNVTAPWDGAAAGCSPARHNEHDPFNIGD